MNWYVKVDSTGEIIGPVTKEKAEHLATASDGLIFNEDIFDENSTEPPIKEVTQVLEDLQGIVDKVDDDVSGRVISIVQRSIDAIHFFSREKVVTGSIEGGVFSIGEVPAGVSMDIRDYDTEGMDESQLKEDEHGDMYFQAG